MSSKGAILWALVCLAVLFPAALADDEEREGPRRKKWSRDQVSYKKLHRDQMTKIAGGNVEPAIEWFERYLKDEPDDPEALYGLAVAHARIDELDIAMDYVEKALAVGLPFGRFLAGPRNLLAPLVESRAFRKLRKKQRVELIHGPMLGAVTHESARFWVRTASEAKVRIRVGTNQRMDGALTSRTIRTREDRDYTSVVEVSGLSPATRYFYEVRVGGKNLRIDPPPAFRTSPPPGERSRIQVGFGGGAGYTPWNERMWDTLHGHDFPAFVMLGDNVYIDAPQVPETQRYCYYRRYSGPEWRRFTAATSIHAIWDDHDFSTNEGIGGASIDFPYWKRQVWRIFTENFNNPYYGGGDEQPGCWHDFSIGDVDFFLLDGRYYRTAPEGPTPTMLGPAQKRWFLEKLRASRATFKVLASPVPWAFGTKKGTAPTGRERTHDTWEGYPDERQEIFRFIAENRIEGVVLISADRHRSDAWKIPRDDGYTLYDFMSSRLTNNKFHRSIEDANCLYSYDREPSFGMLTFDTDLPDPTVTYQIVNIDDEVLYTLTLKKSELSFGDPPSAGEPRE